MPAETMRTRGEVFSARALTLGEDTKMVFNILKVNVGHISCAFIVVKGN